MDLTVASALELEVFARGDAKVLAAAHNLDRTVRWVHSGEIADIAKFLSGGEMLLTAGLGFGDTEAQQRRYVRSIAEAGASVLVVEHAGRAFTEVPEAVISEAELLELPLIGLAKEIPFVEVSALVHGLLVDLRVAELTEDEEISLAFTDLLLGSADYLTLAGELSRRLGWPVVLEDRAHQVLGYVGRTDGANHVIENWSSHSRLLHQQDPDIDHRASVAVDYAPCTRAQVVLRGELWGWLHVLHGGEALRPSGMFAVQRAAAAVAISLLSERESGARSAQRHGALINRLMLGDLSGEDFVAKAVALGRDMRNKAFVVALVGSDVSNRPFGEHRLTALLKAANLTAIVAEIGDQVLAVIALEQRGTDRIVVDKLTEAGVRAGTSRVVNAKTLFTAVQQARNAGAAAAVAPEVGVHRFDDLGILRLLVVLAQGPELARYVEDELGPLLQHDAGAANQLMPTLRVYLDCDGKKSDAANRLFIQRRTLYYRLERISSLLKLSLDDVDSRQRLLLAVRGLDLLRRPLAPEN
jgi:purine catabolism regulator